MYIEALPKEVLYAMPENAYRTAAWNAAVDGIATSKTRIISMRNGRWVAACADIRDIAILTKNNDVLYNLRRIDNLRRLPYVHSICPIPDNVSSAQARLHRDFNEVFRTSHRSDAGAPHPDTTLSLIRRLPVKSMPVRLWHALAWKLSAGPELAAKTAVRGVIDGTWIIACADAQTRDEVASSAAILPMLRWLSRYRAYDAGAIKPIFE